MKPYQNQTRTNPMTITNLHIGDTVTGTMHFADGRRRCDFRGTMAFVGSTCVSIASESGYFSVNPKTITKIKPKEPNANQAAQAPT